MELEIEVLEAAATWYVRFGAEPPNDGERQAWREWLEADPRHRRAWERIERLQGQWAVLPVETSLHTLAGVRARRRALLKTLALLACAAGSGWLASGGLSYRALLAGERTGVGERRQLRLADGTRVDLSSATALDLAYDESLRQAYLWRGEILVESAQSAPFQRALRGAAHARLRPQPCSGATPVANADPADAPASRPAGSLRRATRLLVDALARR